ncbi:MAG: hypothetical protein COZ06_32390 [Armatimonadetes bacterium CG_4_10_14_3_um_filter_66_18]|nr:DUF4129 domain-containing protein [Armatimonadota bacterium]PIU92952.1 MAG: hypothetical protein COS65_15235 [Armatimonadetes bacterium CG06_land_8_20_14_3_00_66_21]PIX40301.1 MAG: hypothetical protein COZ57_26225 [Armatimonadetes bacterium CG_4_8_14_3_um_filter_66_20]PIY37662.1 MAG: hypothetical protein COZ06_32390 [Armatimonadetes bacterium CG_4_10_14_3_um_filter_66_18]PIZ33396.1 MAG: hypothetical protein COY42_30085 [Armatimonadetes bacterium CG_4_10_14_0_8_um_filter_66_14]PJB63461.1 MAG
MRRGVVLASGAGAILLVWSAAALGAAGELPLASIRTELSRAESLSDAKGATRHLRRALAKLPGRQGKASLDQRLRDTLKQAVRTRSSVDRRSLIHCAKAQLDSLEAALSLPGADGARQARATAKLREVLSRREYRHNDLQERVMAWIAAWVVRFLRWLSAHTGLDFGGSATAARVLAGVVGFAALCLAAYFAANAVSALLQGRRAVAADGKPLSTSPGGFSPRSARRTLLDEAARHAASGDYRQALRCLYQALLLTLHLNQFLDYDANRTNREYLGLLRAGGNAAVAAAFDQATRLFERKWYGCQQTHRADVDAMSRLLESAEKSVSG